MERTNVNLPQWSDFPFSTNLFIPELDFSHDELGHDTLFFPPSIAPGRTTMGSSSEDTASRTSDRPHVQVQPLTYPSPPEINGLRLPSPVVGTKRKRSSIACKHCHDKRVRCDAAAHGTPCSNCRFRNTQCDLIDSKRGRDKRGLFERGSDNNPSPLNKETKELPRPPISGADPVPLSERVRRVSVDDGQILHVDEPSIFSWLLGDHADDKHLYQLDESCLDAAERAPTRQEQLNSPADSQASQVSQDFEHDMLDLFCQHFYPVYPILNKTQLLDTWEARTISPLLKQTVIFVGALHCRPSVLTDAGFSNKRDAISQFYHRARNLYDSDTEDNRTCVVQCMFMLQFHYGPNTGYRDNLWWQSAAVCLAQIVGMHRCTEKAGLKPEDQRLWKKIWWQLYIRDRQVAAGIGKPMMINERDCDVGDLTVEDFVDGESRDTAYFVIEMAKLAKLTMEVVHCRFQASSTPVSNESNKVRVHLALQNWQASLHSSMREPSNPTEHNRFALILSFAYHQQLLLFHLPTLEQAKAAPERRDFSTQLAFYAVDKISNLAGEVLRSYEACEFPSFVQMIILAAMAFQSVDTTSPKSDENDNYALSLLKLDQVYFLLCRFRLIFGGRTSLFSKITSRRPPSSSGVTSSK